MISVILVDEKDQEKGTGEKLWVHQKSLLHRAFSVFIFNDQGEVLLQRRAEGKYHSPGLWANTCCGHPYPQEPVKTGAERRLKEEMGFSCPLTFVEAIHYQLKVDQGLFEHEYVHIFQGQMTDTSITPCPDEVSEFRWISPLRLHQEVLESPSSYARWFRLYILKYFEKVFCGHPSLSFSQAA